MMGQGGEVWWAATIRTRIAVLVLACVFPAFIATGLLVIGSHDTQRARVDQTIAAASHGLALVVERDLAAVEAALLALSTSPSIDTGDLESLDRQVRQVLAQSPGLNILLIDLPGQQLINTLRPFGQPLPKENQSALMMKVLETARPSITDLFYGPVMKKNLVAMVVPVLRGSKVVAFLSMSLDAAHLEKVLAQQVLPPGWVVTVLDAKGIIITRTGSPEMVVGQPGMREVLSAMETRPDGLVGVVAEDGGRFRAAYHRSPGLGWTVAVEAPESILDAERTRSLRLNLVTALVLLLLGLLLGHRIGLGISRPIQALIAPALAIGRGEPLELPHLGLREVEQVAGALVRAQDLLEQREQERDAARAAAATDALTGLPNRRRFDMVLEAEFLRMHRSGGVLSLILFDIDHFKLVNDTQGHLAGDACLRQLAAIIDGIANRIPDFSARYGGEEFVTILPETDLVGALAVAERLHQAIADAAIPHPASPVAPVLTVSMGVVAVRVDGRISPQELLSLADQQLYAAKAAGRNRLESLDLATAE